MKSVLAPLSRPLAVSPRLTHALRGLGLYAGASTSAVLFADWAVRRYALSPFLVDALLVTLVVALPTVLALALPAQAHPARWWRRRRVVALINALAALALLTTLFHDKPLGATLQMVTVPGADGTPQTRAIPQAAFRTRLALAPLRGDAETAQAVSRALEVVLGADPYVTAFGPDVFGPALQRASLTPADAPDALLIEAGRKLSARYVVTGSAERAGERYALHLRVASVDHTLSHEVRLEDADLLRLADRAAGEVRAAVDLPAADIAPAADLLTSEVPALVAYAGALARYQFEGDYAGAAGLLAEATRLDPTFAYAHLYTHAVRSALGEDDQAAAALARAQQHRYRLPEASRLRVSAVQARDEGRMDDALTAARSYVALFPDDVRAYHLLSDLLQRSGETDEAADVLRRALPVDPGNQGTFARLQRRLRELGQPAEALERALAYAEANPDDWSVHGWTAALYSQMNRHEDALAAFEQGALLNPQQIDYLESVASTQARLGRWSEADRSYTRALAQAATPRDSAVVLRWAAETDAVRGRLGQAAARVELRVALLRRIAPEIEAWRYAVQNAHLRARLGETGYPSQALASALASLPPGAGQAEGRLRRSAAFAMAVAGQHAEAARQAELARALLGSLGETELLALDAVEAHRLAAQDRYADAARALDASARFHQGAWRVFALRAEMHRLAGNAQAARADAEHVLTLFPAHPGAHLTLAHLASGAPRQRHLDAALSAWAGADEGFAPLAEAQRLARSASR